LTGRQIKTNNEKVLAPLIEK